MKIGLQALNLFSLALKLRHEVSLKNDRVSSNLLVLAAMK